MARTSALLRHNRHPPPGPRKPHVGVTWLVSLGLFTGVACLLVIVTVARHGLRNSHTTLAEVYHRSKHTAEQSQPALELNGIEDGWPYVAPTDGALHEFIHGTCPTKACHASTLVHTPSGETLAAWFGGTAEKDPDTGIWLARKPAHEAWRKPFLVAKVSTEPHWNPVLFYDQPASPLHQQQAARLWLHFKAGPSPRQWRTYAASSEDDFVSWTDPRPVKLLDLHSRGDISRGCVKNKPLVRPDRTILAGSSLEDPHWRAFVDVSTDGGVSWNASGEIAVAPELKRGKRQGVIQPTLWASSGSTIHMLLRSNLKFVFRADSTDGGRSWTQAYRTDIIHNNSGLDLVRLSDGTLVLAHNPVKKGRFPLRLSLSHDNGISWPAYVDMDRRPGEYSYPAIVGWQRLGKIRSNHTMGISLTYTWNRQRIAFVSMTMHQLLQRCEQAPGGSVV